MYYIVCDPFLLAIIANNTKPTKEGSNHGISYWFNGMAFTICCIVSVAMPKLPNNPITAITKVILIAAT